MRYRVLAVIGLVAILLAGRGDACEGARAPVCNRSAWFSMLRAKSVVLADGAIDVEVTLVPYATWTPTPPCPQPTEAGLELTLTCPAPSGPDIEIATGMLEIAAPSRQGAQVPFTRTLTIPAGRLDPRVPVECTVTGTYTLFFEGMAPTGGPIMANGAVNVCLVPASPLDPTVPRLDLCCISRDGALIRPMLRGDQLASYYIVCNNDTKQSVSLDLTSDGLQLATLPVGFSAGDPTAAFAANVTSYSSPVPGTDTFAAVFAEDIVAGAPPVIRLGNPLDVDPVRLTRTITLRPLECEILCIVQRSHGMCQDGSCTQRFVRVEGTFDDGTPALGCATSAIYVGGAPPQRPLCRFEVRKKVADGVQAQFSIDSFFDVFTEIEHATTHSRGNVAPGQSVVGHPDARATQLAGVGMPQDPSSPSFPPEAFDTLALEPNVDGNPTAMELEVFAFPVTESLPGDSVPFVQSPSFNFVRLEELDLIGRDLVSIPLFGGLDSRTPTDLRITLGAVSGLLEIEDLNFPGTPIFQGTLDEFVQQPPPIPITVDLTTCTEIRKIQDPSEGFITTAGGRRTFFVGKRDDPTWLRAPLEVFEGHSPVRAPWDANVDTVVTRLTGDVATGGTTDTVPIEMVALDLQSVDPLQVRVGWATVASPSGLNSVDVPLAIRQTKKTSRPRVKKGGEGGVGKGLKKVLLGDFAIGTLIIRNLGKGPFSFDLVDLPDGPFAILNRELIARHTLYPKSEMPVRILYMPKGTEKNKGRDKLTWELPRCDSARPLRVKLTGTWKRPPE